MQSYTWGIKFRRDKKKERIKGASNQSYISKASQEIKKKKGEEERVGSSDGFGDPDWTRRHRDRRVKGYGPTARGKPTLKSRLSVDKKENVGGVTGGVVDMWEWGGNR